MQRIVILFALLLSSQVNANGVFFSLAVQNANAKSHEPAESNKVVQADGYVLVRSFYFDGPNIMVCPERDGVNVVVNEGACALKETKRLPFFSLSWSGVEHSYQSLGAGVTIQQFLDNRFGVGAVVVAGTSLRTGIPEESLIVYYTINKTK